MSYISYHRLLNDKSKIKERIKEKGGGAHKKRESVVSFPPILRSSSSNDLNASRALRLRETRFSSKKLRHAPFKTKRPTKMTTTLKDFDRPHPPLREEEEDEEEM